MQVHWTGGRVQGQRQGGRVGEVGQGGTVGNLHLVPNFFETDSETFSILKFSETDSETFFGTKFFRYRFRDFFRYQIFSRPVPGLFSVPNFSDTGSDTIKKRDKFPGTGIPGTGTSHSASFFSKSP